MSTNEYRVTGMTCEHCVRAVREEVGAIPGVSGVDVDLTTGLLRVDGDGVAADQVDAAVTEAGYTLDATP